MELKKGRVDKTYNQSVSVQIENEIKTDDMSTAKIRHYECWKENI